MSGIDDFITRWSTDPQFQILFRNDPEAAANVCHLTGKDRKMVLAMRKLPDQVLEVRISKIRLKLIY